MDAQNPNTESDMVSELDLDVPAMQSIADKAASGTVKTQMTKVAGDYSSMLSYLKANPNLTSSGSSELGTLRENGLTDVTTLDGTCGIPAPNASS